jgi:ketosteroid isomerase-like protein
MKSIFFIIITCASLMAQGQRKDSLEVVATTQKFLKAFTGFDWKTFRNSFTNDATIFYPTWEQGKRKIGQKEIEATWLEIFPEFIDSTKKFKMEINPQDVFIQLYDRTAIVTFHLDSNYLSRRTFVFRKVGKDWKITHLHASNLSKTSN